MEIERLDNKKERHCTNCEYCKKHYLYCSNKAELDGMSCDITNASVRIVGTDEKVYGLLFKQCPLAKKGEL